MNTITTLLNHAQDNNLFRDNQLGHQIQAILHQDPTKNTKKKTRELAKLLQIDSLPSIENIQKISHILGAKLAALNVLHTDISQRIATSTDEQTKELYTTERAKVSAMMKSYSRIVQYLQTLQSRYAKLDLSSKKKIQGNHLLATIQQESEQVDQEMHDKETMNPLDDIVRFMELTDRYLPNQQRAAILNQRKHRVQSLLDKLGVEAEVSTALRESLQQKRTYIYTMLEERSIPYAQPASANFFNNYHSSTRLVSQGSISSAQQYEVKPKDDIIGPLFDELESRGVELQTELQIIPSQDGLSLYIYCQKLNLTIVISNQPLVSTQLYPTYVSIDEVISQGVKSLKARYHGRQQNFNASSRVAGRTKILRENINDMMMEEGDDSVQNPSVTGAGMLLKINRAGLEQASLDQLIHSYRHMADRYSESDRRKIHYAISNRFYDKYDISPDKKIKEGQKYKGFVTSINHEKKKIHLTIGGNNDDNITVFVKVEDYALDLDSVCKFDEFNLRVGRIYPGTRHIACQIIEG